MSNMLLDLIERNTEKLPLERLASESVMCASSFRKDIDLIRIQTVSDLLLSAKKPLMKINKDIDVTNGIDMPDIHPVKYTASIPFYNFYESDDIYRKYRSNSRYHILYSKLQINIANLFS